MNVEKYLLNVPSQKIKFGLKRTKDLLKVIGNPEKNIFSIQILGTNGKGSTAAILFNILKQKYKVGLYTSPHLIRLQERIKTNNKTIDNKTIKNFLVIYKKQIEKIKPSFFEIMTALAVWHFNKQKVDIAILETGLGGRLDSVTACKNNILGFTNISKDHESLLGNTLVAISNEKAGAILSSNQNIFSVNQKTSVLKTIKKHLKNKNNKNYNVCKPVKYKLNLLKGEHQKINAGLANKIAEYLSTTTHPKINKHNIVFGTKHATWPGRFEQINKNPEVIFDVAHNNDGLIAFRRLLKKHIKKKQFKKLYLICAFEDSKTIGKELQKTSIYFNSVLCTETGIKKSMPCKKIEKYILCNNCETTNNIKKGINSVLSSAKKNDLICIIGSHYFGPFLKFFK